MRAWSNRIAGLLLGLTLLFGGVAAVGAQGGHPAATTPASAQATAPQSQACAQQDKADTGTEQAAETESAAEKAADTDNIDLQCGDQNGPDNATGGSASVGGSRTTALNHAPGLSLLAAKTGHANGAVLAQQSTNGTATGNATSTETESATETETAKGADTDTLNVTCDQQGNQEGDNFGC